MATRIPQRSEVWIVDMGMVGKTRPCVIVSIEYLPHERMLVTIVPGTASIMQTRFEVTVNASFLQGPSVFDAQQIYTVHQVKFVKRLGKLPPDQFAMIEEAVKKWIGLI